MNLYKTLSFCSLKKYHGRKLCIWILFCAKDRLLTFLGNSALWQRSASYQVLWCTSAWGLVHMGKSSSIIHTSSQQNMSTHMGAQQGYNYFALEKSKVHLYNFSPKELAMAQVMQWPRGNAFGDIRKDCFVQKQLFPCVTAHFPVWDPLLLFFSSHKMLCIYCKNPTHLTEKLKQTPCMYLFTPTHPFF